MTLLGVITGTKHFPKAIGPTKAMQRAILPQTLLILLLASLAACSVVNPYEATEPDETAELVIRTEENTYRFNGSDLSVPVVIENKGGVPLYLDAPAGFPSFSAQKLIDGEWVGVYAPIRLLVSNSPTKLSAGEGLEVAFTLGLGDRWSAEWEYAPKGEQLTGMYRFVIGASTTRGKAKDDYKGFAKGRLPLESVVSNPFNVIE